MNDVFFTSDHHFGHNLMLKQREIFSDIDDMEYQMIERWNSVISKNDRVYYLGDLSFAHPNKTIKILNQLNGKIYYIFGNHDRRIRQDKKLQERFEWAKDYFRLIVNKQDIILSHYCFHVWDKHHYGSWHLYGHSHGNIKDNSNRKRMDVGVDTNEYYPYSYEEIKKEMEKKKLILLDQQLEVK